MNTAQPLKLNAWLIWIYFIFLSLVWGSSFILMKRGLEVFSAWQVASLRLISALCVLVFFAARSLKNIPNAKLPFVLASGLFSSLIPSFLFCAAQQGINSSTAGILNALTPSFTFLIGYLFFQQAMSWKIIAGLIVGLFGTAVLVLINPNGEVNLNFYSLFVILATVSYGINLNLVKRHIGNINPLDFTTVAITFSGILASLYMLTTDLNAFWQGVNQHPSSFVAVLTLGVFGTAIAQIALNRLINLAGSIFASANTYVIPIIAIFWGVYDGETLLIWHFLGMALILASIAILNRKK